ncbi:acyltransferase family protein [Streptomyces fulvoviolaceus]|uniref:acyltransferase family protein n=1 Tax=Streptomyces fulvoviolaceus TaxID=285535 RepID=UPI000693E547|nr:acyltransferase [Streptomyces fulvoviolaceus]
MTAPDATLQKETATVAVPDTGRDRAPALDGLRALAALLVIAIHVGIYTGQVASSWLGIGEGGPLGPVISRFTVGVPIFFVLSGLLLYRPYANAARDGRARPSASRYLWHRVLRIFPVYWAVTMVALLWFGRDTLESVWPTLRALLLLHIYEHDPIPLGITQTWSLATEVAFYAVLPLLAWGLHPLLRRGRTGAVFAVLAAVEAVTLVTVVATHVPSAGPYPLAQLWLPEYAGYFAAGIGLAVLASRVQDPPAFVRRPWLCWGVALAAYVLVSTPLTGTTARYPTVAEALWEHGLYLVVAVALVAPLALADGSRGPAALLRRPVPAWLGRISYGLFLWHMVVVEGWLRITGQKVGTAEFAVLFPVTVALTVVLAALSHYLIELPARRLRSRAPLRPVPQPAAP